MRDMVTSSSRFSLEDRLQAVRKTTFLMGTQWGVGTRQISLQKPVYTGDIAPEAYYDCGNGPVPLECSHDVGDRFTIEMDLSNEFNRELNIYVVGDVKVSIGGDASQRCSFLSQPSGAASCCCKGVVIGSGIERIGNGAFQWVGSTGGGLSYYDFSSFDLVGSDVEYIDANAFYNTAHIPIVTSQVIRIADFTNASSTYTVTFSNRNVGPDFYYSFNGCSVLRNLTLPSGVTSVPERAFYNASRDNYYGPNLLSVNLSSLHIDSIGAFAFYGCQGLQITSADIPYVHAFPESCFEGCTRIRNMTLSDVTVLGNNCFKGCTSIAQVSMTLSDPVEVGSNVFSGCTSLTSATIGNVAATAARGWQGMFSGCTALSAVTLRFKNNNSGYIGSFFSGLSALTEANIHNATSAYVYGGGAFAGCTSLQVVRFSQDDYRSGGVSDLSGAFTGCPSLTDVYIDSSREPFGYTDSFYPGSTVTIHAFNMTDYDRQLIRIKQSGKSYTLVVVSS